MTQQAFDWTIPKCLTLNVVYSHQLDDFSVSVELLGEAGACLARRVLHSGSRQVMEVLEDVLAALADPLALWLYDDLHLAILALHDPVEAD